MEPAPGAEKHRKQNPEDDGIWTHAPVERQIHEESIQAMKITMAEVNAKIHSRGTGDHPGRQNPTVNPPNPQPHQSRHYMVGAPTERPG